MNLANYLVTFSLDANAACFDVSDVLIDQDRPEN